MKFFNVGDTAAFHNTIKEHLLLDVAETQEDLNNAILEESAAKTAHKRRKYLKENPKEIKTSADRNLCSKQVSHYYDDWKAKNTVRKTAKKDYDEAAKALDSHKDDEIKGFVKENDIQKVGNQYRTMWTHLPRYALCTCKLIKSLKYFQFSYLHDAKHYMICIDREDPSVVYVSLKNRLMTSHVNNWCLIEAVQLLQRLIDSFDEDLACVKDYIDKVKRKLESKSNDTDFTKLQACFLLSMCLSKPHQMAFDIHMKTLRETKPVPTLLEPFDKALRAKMVMAQRKHLTGDSRQLPLGDLSKVEYRKCSLIATQKIRPDEPKKSEAPVKKTKTVVKKVVKKAVKETKPKSTTKPKAAVESTPKVVEQPVTKKVKKTKVPSEHVQAVMDSLQAHK